jgi:hypothetical protein
VPDLPVVLSGDLKMCPQVVLFALLDAYARNDRVAVAEHLENLAEWNRKGGFSPTIDRPPGQSVAHFVVRRVIAEAGPTPEDLDAPTVTPLGNFPRPGGMEEMLIEMSSDEAMLWHSVPVNRTEVSPGDHVLLPAGWRDGNWDGEPEAVLVVQREHAFNDQYCIVTPLDDDCYETSMSRDVLHWGRIQWLAENATMGSGSHGAETFREGGDEDEQD